jgi:hypothetical protein
VTLPAGAAEVAPAAGGAVAIDAGVTGIADQRVGGWGGGDLAGVDAGARLGADGARLGAPRAPVARPGGECMGDFVQDGVANHHFGVEGGECKGEGDAAGVIIARPEATAGAIEGEAPIVQTVVRHQGTRKRFGVGVVHVVEATAGRNAGVQHPGLQPTCTSRELVGGEGLEPPTPSV